MRTLIPLLILGALLILAGEWQSRNSGPLRPPAGTDREGAWGAVEGSGSGADATGEGEAWDLLVLGRPSGAEPLRRPETLVPAPPPIIDAPPAPEPRPVPSDARYIVQPNDALGLICQTHYEVRPLSSVVKAVADYNDLKSVDAIKSGDVLLLPDPAVLFQSR